MYVYSVEQKTIGPKEISVPNREWRAVELPS